MFKYLTVWTMDNMTRTAWVEALPHITLNTERQEALRILKNIRSGAGGITGHIAPCFKPCLMPLDKLVQVEATLGRRVETF